MGDGSCRKRDVRPSSGNKRWWEVGGCWVLQTLRLLGTAHMGPCPCSAPPARHTLTPRPHAAAALPRSLTAPWLPLLRVLCAGGACAFLTLELPCFRMCCVCRVSCVQAARAPSSPSSCAPPPATTCRRRCPTSPSPTLWRAWVSGELWCVQGLCGHPVWVCGGPGVSETLWCVWRACVSLSLNLLSLGE